MERKIIQTGDGSTTIHLPKWNEQYHSKHGAIQEAYHVFIKSGLEYFIQSEFFKNSLNKSIAILEIGFGTGLNALITLTEAQKLNIQVDYCGVEAYPVKNEELKQLNYCKELDVKSGVFDFMHNAQWDKNCQISEKFSLVKQHKFFDKIDDHNRFNIIYFDAFGARVQPELWTEVIFAKMYAALKPNGVLVTYSAKGSVKRAMIASGFQVEKLLGPPGKREMLRAIKVSS